MTVCHRVIINFPEIIPELTVLLILAVYCYTRPPVRRITLRITYNFIIIVPDEVNHVIPLKISVYKPRGGFSDYTCIFFQV